MKSRILLTLVVLISGMVNGQAPMIFEGEFTETWLSEHVVIRGSATYKVKDSAGNVVGSGSLTEGTDAIIVPEPGIYDIEISNTQNFAINPQDIANGYKRFHKFKQWGDTDLNPNLVNMFAGSGDYGGTSFEMTATDTPNFKPGTSLRQFFALSTIFSVNNIENWDMSNVTDMTKMFLATPNFNQDLSNWDTSAVTTTDDMFYGADAFNGDISTWDVSNVISMDRMFYLTKSFNQDLTNWNTGKVKSMVGMFGETKVFNGDISTWDVSKVLNMERMFYLAESFNQDLPGWDVSRVENMRRMFWAVEIFNGDISTWNVGNVWEMYGMFQYATSFNSDLSAWDVSKVVEFFDMFNGAESFTSDLSQWNINTTYQISMAGMFQNAHSFDSDLSNWDMSHVATMYNMLDHSGMPCENYTRTLRGWGNQEVLHDKELGVNGLQYGPAAIDARNTLINEYNWTFKGDLYNENCLLGITDSPEGIDIQVVNPVKEYIYIKSPLEIIKAELFDMTGRKIKEFKELSSSAAELTGGVYLLRISTPNGVKTVKILKQ